MSVPGGSRPSAQRKPWQQCVDAGARWKLQWASPSRRIRRIKDEIAEATRRIGYRNLVFLVSFAVAHSNVQLVAGASAKSRRSKDSYQESTTAAVAILVLLFILCGGGIGWCIYLEYAPAISQTRNLMLWIALVCLFVEMACFYFGVLAGWTVPILLFHFAWGPLDAVVRFPHLHNFLSAFTAKQTLLLITRVIIYIFGLVKFSDSKVTFFSFVMVEVIGLPLLYILALPLDDLGTTSVNDFVGVADEDILIRCWKFATDAKERRESIVECRRQVRMLYLTMVRRFPSFAKAVLVKADPSIQKIVNKTGRAI